MDFVGHFPRAYYLLHPEGFQLMSLLFISDFFLHPSLLIVSFLLIFYVAITVVLASTR